MKKKKFETAAAPIPSRHIAQVSLSPTGVAYLSGQISQDLATGEPIHSSVAEQTFTILSNIQKIVESLGAGMDDVIKCNCFVSSMDVFPEMDRVYREFFSEENPPARQTVAAGIWAGLDVEISCEVLLPPQARP